MRCPIKKLDPDSCVDFSTNGTLVNDKFREGYDKIFGRSGHFDITDKPDEAIYNVLRKSLDYPVELGEVIFMGGFYRVSYKEKVDG